MDNDLLVSPDDLKRLALAGCRFVYEDDTGDIWCRTHQTYADHCRDANPAAAAEPTVDA